MEEDEETGRESSGEAEYKEEDEETGRGSGGETENTEEDKEQTGLKHKRQPYCGIHGSPGQARAYSCPNRHLPPPSSCCWT